MQECRARCPGLDADVTTNKDSTDDVTKGVEMTDEVNGKTDALNDAEKENEWVHKMTTPYEVTSATNINHKFFGTSPAEIYGKPFC